MENPILVHHVTWLIISKIYTQFIHEFTQVRRYFLCFASHLPKERRVYPIDEVAFEGKRFS